MLPADGKIGNITAIFKNGNKCGPSNYRVQTNQSAQHYLQSNGINN